MKSWEHCFLYIHLSLESIIWHVDTWSSSVLKHHEINSAMPKQAWIKNSANSLYLSSERSKTGGYTAFTFVFVCLSVRTQPTNSIKAQNSLNDVGLDSHTPYFLPYTLPPSPCPLPPPTLSLLPSPFPPPQSFPSSLPFHMEHPLGLVQIRGLRAFYVVWLL